MQTLQLQHQRLLASLQQSLDMERSQLLQSQLEKEKVLVRTTPAPSSRCRSSIPHTSSMCRWDCMSS